MRADPMEFMFKLFPVLRRCPLQGQKTPYTGLPDDTIVAGPKRYHVRVMRVLAASSPRSCIISGVRALSELRAWLEPTARQSDYACALDATRWMAKRRVSS